MAAEERKAIVAAHNALELMLEWDRKRDFIVPYKVRDPINAALKQLREVIATPGVPASDEAQQAARYRWLRDHPSLSKIVALMARTEPAEWDATIDRERAAPGVSVPGDQTIQGKAPIDRG